MLEFNVAVRFPAAPLLTVILALVGKLCNNCFLVKNYGGILLYNIRPNFIATATIFPSAVAM